MKYDLRLVVLEYPKLILKQELVRRVFADLLVAKQLNYERTSADYVSLGPHDLIGSHFLIYDQRDMFNPKLVAGLRIGYGERSRRHRLRLPIEDHVGFLPRDVQEKLRDYRGRHENLVQVNYGFVDADYGYSKTGLKLLELTFVAAQYFAVRKGFDHWIIATNDKLKTYRWAMKTGSFEPGLTFVHPDVNDIHQLLLVETYNYDWLQEQLKIHRDLIENRIEILPSKYPDDEILLSADEANQRIAERRSGHVVAA